MVERIDTFFGVTKSGSSFRAELRGGVTTFLTMAYILFVNPDILSKAIPIEGAFAELLTTTALAAAVGTLTMALVARYPFALAPGMGLNAYFTFTVVLGQGVPWRAALGAVLLSGILCSGLSVLGVRDALVRAIPLDLRAATGAGIGMFLALIGAESGGWVVDHPATLVTLGPLGSPTVAIASFGLFVTGALVAFRLPGAILLGISLTTALAIATGAPVYQGAPFAGFGEGIVHVPVWPEHLFLALDLTGAFELGIVGIVFTFAFVDLFDTAGTLVGLGDRAGFTDREGNLPRASRAFFADSMGTVTGALFGTSSTTTYIESAAGIEAGARTGFASVVTALLFLLATAFWPLAAAVPAAATAPILVLVGAFMMDGLRRIEWGEPRRSIPAFITILAMPLTFSIANGIGLGILAWVVLHATTGRHKDVHPFLYGIAVLLVLRYAWLAEG